MDADPKDSQKDTPKVKKICYDKSDLTTSKDTASDIESDEEDEEISPSRYNKSNSGRPANRKSSPVRIYSYKVDSWIFLSFRSSFV